MILTGANEPFKNMGAAALAANRKKIKDFTIEPYKNGFAIIEKNQTVKDAEKAATTSPWDANECPWKPDIFKTGKTKPGFKIHFSTQKNVQKRLDEGYKCARAEDWGSHSDGPDGILRREGMVGMELPIELYNQRLAYNAYRVAQQSGKTKEDVIKNAQNIIDTSKSGTGLTAIKGRKSAVQMV